MDMQNEQSYRMSASNTQILNEWFFFPLLKPAHDNFGKYRIENDNHKLQLCFRKSSFT